MNTVYVVVRVECDKPVENLDEKIAQRACTIDGVRDTHAEVWGKYAIRGFNASPDDVKRIMLNVRDYLCDPEDPDFEFTPQELLDACQWAVNGGRYKHNMYADGGNGEYLDWGEYSDGFGRLEALYGVRWRDYKDCIAELSEDEDE